MLSELVEHFKKISKNTMEDANPVNILFGTVISNAPLQIDVEQRLLLGERQLVLCQNLTDYAIEAEINQETVVMRMMNGLHPGDQVVLIRMQGGQKFFVMDRVVNA